ncbi:unnamed protein product [Durusdinium trenchii]|uniref:Uncharacterized protein n=2 Tax=Durusdinium trenchii TaxID=1381693 RepID=A0ABP0KE14_9DINO
MASVLMEMICGTPIPAEHPVDVAPFEGTLTHEEDSGKPASAASSFPNPRRGGRLGQRRGRVQTNSGDRWANDTKLSHRKPHFPSVTKECNATPNALPELVLSLRKMALGL